MTIYTRSKFDVIDQESLQLNQLLVTNFISNWAFRGFKFAILENFMKIDPRNTYFWFWARNQSEKQWQRVKIVSKWAKSNNLVLSNNPGTTIYQTHLQELYPFAPKFPDFPKSKERRPRIFREIVFLFAKNEFENLIKKQKQHSHFTNYNIRDSVRENRYKECLSAVALHSPFCAPSTTAFTSICHISKPAHPWYQIVTRKAPLDTITATVQETIQHFNSSKYIKTKRSYIDRYHCIQHI